MKRKEHISLILNELFQLNRSITGVANRETLRILQNIIPINVKEFSSGQKVFDWVIPDEWKLNEGWIKDANENLIVDFKDSNLHVVSYSNSIDKEMTFEELKPFLHYHDRLPQAIPYRTSYYNDNWGFCINKDQYLKLKQSSYPLKVKIDSEFDSSGSLTIGEIIIPGKSKEEILISTYFCHPSLANDNLSGTVMTAFLAKELLKKKNLNYTYRIIWVPETIGAIAYIAMNEEKIRQIKTGFVITTVGGPGKFGYKKSFDSNHYLNELVEEVFAEEKIDYIPYPFDIHGSDERQYSSPAFRINTVSITKDKYYEYDYYHTSLDNLNFVKGDYIEQSLMLYLKTIDKLENELIYYSKFQNCEVMLSKHKLYPSLGGHQLPGSDMPANELDIILWLLFWCDGKKTLKQISSKIGVEYSQLILVVEKLVKKNILERL